MSLFIIIRLQTTRSLLEDCTHPPWPPDALQHLLMCRASSI